MYLCSICVPGTLLRCSGYKDNQPLVFALEDFAHFHRLSFIYSFDTHLWVAGSGKIQPPRPGAYTITHPTQWATLFYQACGENTWFLSRLTIDSSTSPFLHPFLKSFMPVSTNFSSQKGKLLVPEILSSLISDKAWESINKHMNI